MKKLLTSITLGLGALGALACTGLIATPGATADGSSIVTYAADSHVLYGELYSQPAADHAPGAMRKVVDWDSGRVLGEIPEVAHTYATVGNMNEHALTIVESTWGGRHELADTTGMIDYGSLIYITLQRARTAPEAIKVMTDLVDTYGYASEGESFTIADPNEVWIMELIGKGGKERGAVWVAMKVPDGCISGHANHSRIHKFPLKDKKNCLYSKDVISFAKKMGYYDGPDKDFDFSRAYGEWDSSVLRGCDARVWAFYNKFAPGMEQYIPWIMEGKGEVLPLWVKPEGKLTVKDMQWMMRDHFDGTHLDMHTDLGGGPYRAPYRWRPLTFTVDSVEYTHERAIATQQTGFSLVAQLNASAPEVMKGIMWFGVDDANTCVYVPVYNCANTVPHEFAPGNGDLYNVSWDAAFWVNNYVANQAYNRYSQMIDDIRRVQVAEEDTLAMEVSTLLAEVPAMDRDVAVSLLNDHTALASRRYVKRYKALGDFLLAKYLDGNVKKVDENGNLKRTPEGMPVSPAWPGYDEDYYRNLVRATGDRYKVITLD